MKLKAEDRVVVTDEAAMHVRKHGRIVEVCDGWYEVALDGVNSGNENYDDTQVIREDPASRQE